MADTRDNEEQVDENYDPEAECAGDFKPVKELPQVSIVTGEENEDVLDKFRTKLYRWRDTEFKERGAGDLKFLKNKETQRVRILMRQDKTHKVVANFYVSPKDPLCQLIALKTNDKSWIWSCYDYSDNESILEKLCGRFTSVDEFNRFKKVFEEVKAANAGIEGESKKPEETKEKAEETKEKTEEPAKAE